jgi:hypothetical protein
MRALGFICLLELGCGHLPAHEPTPAPPQTIYIDETFTRAERASIFRGVELWVAAVGVNVTYRLMPFVDLQRLTGQTRFLRAQRREDMPCHDRPGETVIGCFNYGDSAIWLHASNCDEAELYKLAAHELGHSFGLPDLRDGIKGSSLMESRMDVMADKPTSLDIYNYCRLHGC